MRPEHGPQVLAIYQAGMDTGNATFETAAPGWTDFDQRHLPEHRVVALAPGGQVAGWVAAAPVSGRCVYAGVIEHSVYVDSGHAGQGIGAALLQALIQSADAAGVWTIQTGIFPENHASLALHRGAGFRTVGTRERIGQRDGRWRDVVRIERRR
ncbi:phosphinothricin acetyltransferase [Tsukamurella pulmonis]|nr:phosphinothricin acetyltransferase [Tsukamurella pulmonis]